MMLKVGEYSLESARLPRAPFCLDSIDGSVGRELDEIYRSQRHTKLTSGPEYPGLMSGDVLKDLLGEEYRSLGPGSQRS